jgi:uncharacterized alpha-E superfamily protein
MLSRVADRVYWMSRYLERVENTARLVAVYGQLLLDLPSEAGLDWSVAQQIMGMEGEKQEDDPLEFLLSDPRNPASLISALGSARENARTSRDIVPSEAWRAINELYLYACDELPSAVRRPSAGVPEELVGRCHVITGILMGTMSHGPAYQFVRLGRSLERADMTTRMIDVAAATLLAGREDIQTYDNAVWAAVLRALSAYQMYRQTVRRRILGPDVIRFLLYDEHFPRSVTYCFSVLESALRSLPHSEPTLARVESMREQIDKMKSKGWEPDSLHRFIDDLQREFAAVHDAIYDAWLNPMRLA